MFIWFASASFLIVVLVFDSPAIDYRLIIAGSVAPVAEAAVGGPYLLHTLAGSVALLALVVVATRGRRVRARQLVALPVGTFLHLVLDGTWTSGELFWWPLRGNRLGAGRLPEFEHLPVRVLLESIGIILGWWLVRRFELHRADRRRLFLRTGRVARELMR